MVITLPSHVKLIPALNDFMGTVNNLQKLPLHADNYKNATINKFRSDFYRRECSIHNYNGCHGRQDLSYELWVMKPRSRNNDFRFLYVKMIHNKHTFGMSIEIYAIRSVLLPNKPLFNGQCYTRVAPIL